MIYMNYIKKSYFLERINMQHEDVRTVIVKEDKTELITYAYIFTENGKLHQKIQC